MKLLIVSSALALAMSGSFAKGSGGHGASSGGSHSVRGHTTKSGTYVPPHLATNPDKSKTNNWSTKGNVNPYTGKAGTKEPTR